MTRQRDHDRRRLEQGWRRVQAMLPPEGVAALARLRERYPSDAAAVNAAVVLAAHDPDYEVFVDDEWVAAATDEGEAIRYAVQEAFDGEHRRVVVNRVIRSEVHALCFIDEADDDPA